MRYFKFIIIMLYSLLCYACNENTTFPSTPNPVHESTIENKQIQQLTLELQELNNQIPHTRGRWSKFWKKLFTVICADAAGFGKSLQDGKGLKSSLGSAILSSSMAIQNAQVLQVVTPPQNIRSIKDTDWEFAHNNKEKDLKAILASPKNRIPIFIGHMHNTICRNIYSARDEFRTNGESEAYKTTSYDEIIIMKIEENMKRSIKEYEDAGLDIPEEFSQMNNFSFSLTEKLSMIRIAQEISSQESLEDVHKKAIELFPQQKDEWDLLKEYVI